EGVTYSYLSTRFYGKASLKGLFQPKTKTIVIKEIKMLEMRNMDGGDGCLMTCYLDYKKEGSIETLTGNFTGVNIRDGSPCESGTVTLKKVPDSKFKKEDFLLKKETIIQASQNRVLEIQYPSYKEVERMFLPNEINIMAAQKDKIAIDIAYKNTTFNENLSYSFSIPSDYKAIQID
ncbi:MAG: DUF4292 domain-containing protein, partial [Flavobacterium sp.]